MLVTRIMAAIAGRDPRHTITIDRIVKKLTKTNKKIFYILTLLIFLSCSSSGPRIRIIALPVLPTPARPTPKPPPPELERLVYWGL